MRIPAKLNAWSGDFERGFRASRALTLFLSSPRLRMPVELEAGPAGGMLCG